MIKLPSFEGFDYSKTPFSDLMAEIKNIPYYQTHYLGESAGGIEMFGFSLGDLSKPTIYIQGNIHGAHEWRTTHWVKRFMEILANPSSLPQSQTINKLKAKYSFYFIPACNPDGYENNTYGNANGVSISENFDYRWDKGISDPTSPYYKGPEPWSEPEARYIRGVILDKKPISVACTHTWGGYTGLMIRRPVRKDIELIVSDEYQSNLITSQPNSGSSFSPPTNAATVYEWAMQQTSRSGRKIYAHVLETGSLETEYEQARLGLNGLLLYCLYVDHWFTNNTLIIN